MMDLLLQRGEEERCGKQQGGKQQEQNDLYERGHLLPRTRSAGG